MKRLAMLAVSGLLASCGVNPSTPQNYGSGANYSSTPCGDNCGGDANCQLHCTNATAPAFPNSGLPGVAPAAGVNH